MLGDTNSQPILTPIGGDQDDFTKSQADTYYYPISTNPAVYLTSTTAPGAFYWDRNAGTLYPHTSTDRILLGGATDDGTSAFQLNGVFRQVQQVTPGTPPPSGSAPGTGGYNAVSQSKVFTYRWV